MRTLFFFLAGIGFFVFLYSSVFFAGRLRERDLLLDGLIAQSLPLVDGIMHGVPPHTRAEATALALARTIYASMNAPLDGKPLDPYERLEAMSPLNTGPGTALKHGGFGLRAHSQFGPCTTMSRTLILALTTLEIPARAIYVEPDARGLGGGHQMVEFLDGEEWKVIAPSDKAFVWRTRSGTIASLDAIKKSPVIFSQIYEHFPHYPYLFEGATRFSLPGLPTPLERGVAFFMQTYRGKPVAHRLFHLPRSLYLRLSLALSLLFGVAALWLRPKNRMQS